MDISLLTQLILLVAGLAALWAGAEIVVRSATRLAGALGVSPLILGLTVISVGTSIPELVVSTTAALKDEIGISIGNIVGSNISNVGLILGIGALLIPLKVKTTWVRREVPMMIIVTLFFWLFSATGSVIARIEGGLLLIILSAFLYYVAKYTLKEMTEFREIAKQHVSEDVKKTFPWRKRHYLGICLLGLVVLIGGSQLAVDSGTELAGMLGVSHAVIGLTLIAFGTSLPELATTIVSAMRKEADLALGNVIGSNIFNLALIGGTTALIRPIPLSDEVGLLTMHLPIMTFLAIILWPMMYFRVNVQRLEGTFLLLVYCFFLFLIVGSPILP